MNKYIAMGLVLLMLSPLIFMVIDFTFVLYRRWFKGEDAV